MIRGSTHIEERLATLENLLSTLVSARSTEKNPMQNSNSIIDLAGGIAHDGGILNFGYRNHERDGDAVSSLDEPISPRENSALDDTVDGMGLVTFADEGISCTFGNYPSPFPTMWSAVH